MSPVDENAFDFAPKTETGGAALCIHGLTGTPYEVRSLGEALVGQGIRAVGPLLPGHGSRPEKLSTISWEDWVGAVHLNYENLRANYDHVVVIGLSLGGLLSLELASSEAVDGLVVIGAPLSLKKPIPQLVGLVKYFVKAIKKTDGSDIQDSQARLQHPGYKIMPLGGVHQLVLLQKKVRSDLGKITAPALVAHGRLDRTADPRDAKLIYDGLGSEHKELYYCEKSGHVVTVDHGGPELSKRVADFVTGLRLEVG